MAARGSTRFIRTCPTAMDPRSICCGPTAMSVPGSCQRGCARCGHGGTTIPLAMRKLASTATTDSGNCPGGGSPPTDRDHEDDHWRTYDKWQTQHCIEGESHSRPSNMAFMAGVYADRIAGRDRGHRDLDGATAARSLQSKNESQNVGMCGEHAGARCGLADVCR